MEEEKSSATCKLCSGPLHLPRMLPCMHTFCQSCLSSYISQTVDTHRLPRRRRFACPLCKRESTPENPADRKENWARGLPLNTYALRNVKSKQQRMRNFSLGKHLYSTGTVRGGAYFSHLPDIHMTEQSLEKEQARDDDVTNACPDVDKNVENETRMDELTEKVAKDQNPLEPKNKNQMVGTQKTSGNVENELKPNGHAHKPLEENEQKIDTKNNPAKEQDKPKNQSGTEQNEDKSADKEMTETLPKVDTAENKVLEEGLDVAKTTKDPAGSGAKHHRKKEARFPNTNKNKGGNLNKDKQNLKLERETTEMKFQRCTAEKDFIQDQISRCRMALSYVRKNFMDETAIRFHYQKKYNEECIKNDYWKLRKKALWTPNTVPPYSSAFYTPDGRMKPIPVLRKPIDYMW